MPPHLRIARPVTNLTRTEAMYRHGLGWQVLGQFRDHGGFDGVMLGTPGADHHFEFTFCRTHPVAPATTAEDLVVLYLPKEAEWSARCAALEAAGFAEVAAFNPYWATHGRTFVDPDGYRIVVQNAPWPPGLAR